MYLNNLSPFPADCRPDLDLQGRVCVNLALKASFRLDNGLLLPAERQLPIHDAPVLWPDTEPEQDGPRYEDDLTPPKPATDLLINAVAYAPGSQPLTQFEVGLRVAGRTERLRVFGPRVWRQSALLGGGGRAVIETLAPIRHLPLRLALAFGGEVRREGTVQALDARNPYGRGWCGDDGQIDGVLLPQQERPDTLIETPHDHPVPGFWGGYPADCLHRRKLFGTQDAEWLRLRAPRQAADFDPYAYCTSDPSLRFSPHWQGGEHLTLWRLTPDGECQVQIPRWHCWLQLRYAGAEPLRQRLKLDTVLVEPDEGRLCLTWRAQLLRWQHQRSLAELSVMAEEA